MTSKPSEGSSPQPAEPPRPADRAWEWIDAQESLARLIATLRGEPLVGIDTESDSFHHYREQVCLIQISTPTSDYIIDPLAVADLSGMRPLFSETTREWVMNGADYDIVCLKRDFGIHFARIFDTVVAAQLLGYHATGLAAMLDRHFGLKVSKTLQRDEWFRRPLTEEQITYALTDTRYLLPLRSILKAELESMGRLSWAEEEFTAVARREWTREPFSPGDFWKIRGAREVTRQEQAILRELAVARDRLARESNRPPFKVVSDAVLLSLAKLKPRTPLALKKVRGISPLMLRRLGDDLLAAVNQGLNAEGAEVDLPLRTPRRRQDPGASRRLEALKAWRKHKATELHLDPGVLSPLSILQEVAGSNPKTVEDLMAIPDLSRWRAQEFGPEWIKAMAKA
ncbi:MAG TPA: HRDC domain-containing protein [Candidatus Polarisedimenticolia bacterium]|jgi:ribonuclease D